MRLLTTLFTAALAAALLAAPALADDTRPKRKRPGADRRGPPARQQIEQRRRHMQELIRKRRMAQHRPMVRQHGARRGPQRGGMLVFERLDRNKDGVLDRREFAAALAHLKAQGPRGRHARMGRGMRGRAGHMHRGAMMRRQMMRRQMMRWQLRRGAVQGRLAGPDAKRGPGRRPPAARGADLRQGADRKPGARRKGKGPAAGAEARRSKALGTAVLYRLKLADTDKDGKLSKQEAPQLLRKHFARLDKDGDGFLAKAELKGAVKLIAQLRKKDVRKKTKGAEKSASKSQKKRRKPGKKR